MTRQATNRGIPRRWFGYFALGLVFAVACVLLSNWQFARRQEAVAAMALVQSNYDAPPIPISALVPSASSFDKTNEWRPVTVTGVYQPANASLVRNRVSNSEPGYDSVVPFHADNGNVFVVDRGWLASSATGGLPTSIPAAPSGKTSLVVRLRPSEQRVSAQQDTAHTLATLNVEDYSKRWSEPTYTQVYGDLVTEVPAAAHGELAGKPELTEGNHLSYALQWIAFAIMGLFAVGWIIRRERKLASPQSRSTELKSRKKSRDEEAEDAAIDAHVNSR